MEDFEIFYKTINKYSGNDEHVVIPEGITTIKDYAFSSCTQIKTIQLPDSVEEIGDYAFYECKNLERIELPENIYYMGVGAFCRCNSLKSIKLPSKLSSINRLMFYHCPSLETIHLPEKLKTLGKSCFEKCYALKTLHLPDTLISIEDNVFDDCIHLIKLNLPESLTKIGNNVFFNCKHLKQIILPRNIQSIGLGAFETRGEVTIIMNSNMMLKAEMFDNNWNMNWNFGSNKRYNGKNEDNYQLIDSYLPNIIFDEWKLNAKIILFINFLETISMHQNKDHYKDEIRQNVNECLSFMIEHKRYIALENAIKYEIIFQNELEPYFHLIQDNELRIRLMSYQQEDKTDIFDDLFDLL